MRPTTSVPLLAATALLLATACSNDKEKADINVTMGGDSASAMVLADGDVKITSTDGAIVLAVIGDTMRMQLSDSLRNSVNAEISAKTGDKDGLAATITRSVGSVVNSALGFSLRVHVDDVENLRYENGTLQWRTRGGNMNMSSKGDASGRGDNARFTEEDAQKLIAAVESRQSVKPASGKTNM